MSENLRIVNIPEAKALVERYRNITIEEIEEADGDVEILTGMGYSKTCTLCKACRTADYTLFFDDKDCDICVYSVLRETATNGSCYCYEHPDTEPTYAFLVMQESEPTPEELQQGFKDRADVLEKVIKQAEEYNKQFE